MRVLKMIAVLALMAAISSCAGGVPKKTTETKKATHITTAEFETKVAELKKEEWKFLGDKPAIIDFYAVWCPPCKKMAPILDELSQEYDGKIDIYKVDVDVELELARAFNIKSMPTLLFIPMNGQPEIIPGALSKEELVGRINKMLMVE